MIDSHAYKKILVAPSAYKGTLRADQLAEAMAAGIHRSLPDAEVICAPIADGGDGTLLAIHAAVGGQFHSLQVAGALGDPVDAFWLQLDQLAVVELAWASGIAAVPAERLNALAAHTIGTGQVILRCLEQGFADLIVCVGGSASTDGGAGLLSALGARFFDDYGVELPPGGGALLRIAGCDLDQLRRWQHVKFRVATDVTNPLLGEHGAAAVFASQKGASAEELALLEAALGTFSDVLEKDTGHSLRSLSGSGAAGGTAFGLACALDAEIVSGFGWLSQLLQLDEKIASSDLVITAEGRLDHQSVSGKATGELAKLCQRHSKPLWVVPAQCQEGIDWQTHGIDRVIVTGADGVTASATSVARIVAESL